MYDYFTGGCSFQLGMSNKLILDDTSGENVISDPKFKEVDVSAFSLSLNSLNGTIMFAIWPSLISCGRTSETALYPKTVYPTVAFVKLK